MSDAAQPLFEDVFGEAFLSDEEVAPSGLTSADLEEALATADDRHVGQVTARGFGPRFDGDTSQLPPEACWTLQELITAPHVREESRRYWSVLLQHEGILRSRLSELGLILEINREHGYAFTRQASDPSAYSRTLLRARTLTLAASALALYLYNQYLMAPEDPVVETSDMIDWTPTDFEDTYIMPLAPFWCQLRVQTRTVTNILALSVSAYGCSTPRCTRRRHAVHAQGPSRHANG
jgi:hypothetical protein